MLLGMNVLYLSSEQKLDFGIFNKIKTKTQ